MDYGETTDLLTLNNMRFIVTIVCYSIIACSVYRFMIRPMLPKLFIIYHCYFNLDNSLTSHPIYGHLRSIIPNFPSSNYLFEEATVNFHYFLNSTSSFVPTVMWLGWYPMVAVSGHRQVEAVLTKTNLTKHFAYKLIGMKDGLVSADPVKWRVRRKVIEPFFATKKQRQFVKLMDSHISRWSKTLTVNKPIEVETSIHSSALVIVLSSFGSIAKEQSELYLEAILTVINRARTYVMQRIFNPLYWSDVLFKWFPLSQLYFQNMAQIESLVHQIIENRDQLLDPKDANRPDLVDIMRSSGKVDEAGVEEEALTSIAAGHETTATAFNCILLILGNRPDIQERLFQEISEVFPDDKPVDDMDKLGLCPYLGRILKESLRLFPPIPMVIRALDEDVTIEGKKLLKGTNVLINIWTTHRDPEIYPNPEAFDPDRWTPENEAKIPKSAFIPFGYGPRSCIGYRYAYTELKVYIIYMIRKYWIRSLRTFDEVKFRSEVALKPTVSLEFVLTPRTENNN